MQEKEPLEDDEDEGCGVWAEGMVSVRACQAGE